MRLKTVVLPVLGLPTSATRARAPCWGTPRRGAASASGTAMWQHVDGVGHEPREPDARGAHLDDARLAHLAEPHARALGEAERAQQLAAAPVDVGRVQRARRAGGQG